MAYRIDAEGSVELGGRLVPVPRTVSAEARAFLAAHPWGEAPPPSAQAVPMWALREHVDAAMRSGAREAAALFPVAVEEAAIGGVRCQVVRPPVVPPENEGKLLINLHGGGFVLGSGSLIEAIPIAHVARLPVIAVDYRLAPEHPFPAAVDDALTVYRAMLRDHAPEAIGIFGSSAGGFITGQAAMRIAAEALPQPACLGIFTAGGDLADLGDTARIFTLMGFWGEPILPTDHPLSEIRAYLAGADPADPFVSPERGDLSHFPPTLLVSGTRDAVLSGTVRFHRALRRAGRPADLHIFEAMPHAHWYMPHLPEAREAIDLMAGFFLDHLAASRARG